MFDLIVGQAKILDELGASWTIALLVFARCIGFISFAPLIGSKQIPALVKISIAILLSLLIIPIIDVPQEYPRDYKFIYLIVMNASIGMLIGWVISLVITIGRMAGEMLDMQMALNAATLFDPNTQTQSTLVGHFFDYIALVIFISIGGMEKTIEGLYGSFTTFPVVTYDFNFNFFRLLSATSEIISIGFLIVSPIIMIILVMDLILGLMSRAAPQINAFQVSFSLKPSVGVLLLLILMPTLLEVLAKLFNNPTRYFY